MERYLTDRARKRRGWEIPVCGASALFGFFAIQAWIEDSPLDENFVIWLCANAGATLLVLLPLILIIRRRVRVYRARQIAERLAAQSEAEIPLAELDRALGINHAARKIADLLRHRYLQGIGMDGMVLTLDRAEGDAQRHALFADAHDDVAEVAFERAHLRDLCLRLRSAPAAVRAEKAAQVGVSHIVIFVAPSAADAVRGIGALGSLVGHRDAHAVKADRVGAAQRQGGDQGIVRVQAEHGVRRRLRRLLQLREGVGHLAVAVQLVPEDVGEY